MPLLRGLLHERRHRGVGLRDERALRERIDLRDATHAQPPLSDFQLLALLGRQSLCGGDLRFQRGNPHRRRHHIARKGQPRRLQLITLCIDLRLRCFQRAAHAAKNIQRIRHRHRRRIQRERPRLGRVETERLRVDLLTHGRHGAIHRRQRIAELRLRFGLRLTQARLRLHDRRARAQRLVHQRIQRGGPEQVPPIRRHVGIDKMLRFPANNGRGCGFARDGLRGIPGSRRPRRRFEIGTDGTAAQRQRGNNHNAKQTLTIRQRSP